MSSPRLTKERQDSTKERRDSTKERHNSAKDRRDSTKERRDSTKVRQDSTKERRDSNAHASTSQCYICNFSSDENQADPDKAKASNEAIPPLATPERLDEINEGKSSMYI